MPVGKAYDDAFDWHEEMKRSATAKAVAPAEIVYTFPDGWTFQRLHIGPELRAEGESQGHCVGGRTYVEAVAKKEIAVYSLRDAAGVPHVTVEVVPASVAADGTELCRTQQIKGRGNAAVAKAALCHRLERAFAHVGILGDAADWEPCAQIFAKERGEPLAWCEPPCPSVDSVPHGASQTRPRR
jgi:hypothetical protein